MNVTANGIRIHYTDEGQGRPLILCHGYGGSGRDFDGMMETLLSEYRVIRPDSRNSGESEKVTAVHYSDMAEDVAGLIRELKLEKPLFFGFSDGGIVGLLLASRYPELLSAMTVCGANTDPRGVNLKDRVSIARMWHREHKTGLKAILSEPHIKRSELKKIAIPVLVMGGTRDMIRTSHTRRIAKSIPHAILSIQEGETHVSYVIEKDTALQKAMEFFARS